MQLNTGNIRFAGVELLLEEKKNVRRECDPSRAYTIGKVIDQMVDEKVRGLEDAKYIASLAGNYGLFSQLSSELRAIEELRITA